MKKRGGRKQPPQRRGIDAEGAGDLRPAFPCNERKVCARTGRIKTSTTAKITTKEDTRTGTAGRDLIAAPVAIAADTPHIEMPEASGAGHLEKIANDNVREYLV